MWSWEEGAGPVTSQTTPRTNDARADTVNKQNELFYKGWGNVWGKAENRKCGHGKRNKRDGKDYLGFWYFPVSVNPSGITSFKTLHLTTWKT